MKVIFNKEAVEAYGNPKDPQNTPQKVVERLNAQLIILGEFAEADEIEYINKKRRELYVLTKNEKTLTITAKGNTFDGGWLTVDVK